MVLGGRIIWLEVQFNFGKEVVFIGIHLLGSMTLKARCGFRALATTISRWWFFSFLACILDSLAICFNSLLVDSYHPFHYRIFWFFIVVNCLEFHSIVYYYWVASLASFLWLSNHFSKMGNDPISAMLLVDLHLLDAFFSFASSYSMSFYVFWAFMFGPLWSCMFCWAGLCSFLSSNEYYISFQFYFLSPSFFTFWKQSFPLIILYCRFSLTYMEKWTSLFLY